MQSNYINLHYNKLPPVMKDKNVHKQKDRWIFGLVWNKI